MSRRQRQRTLQDLCDATPTQAQPQITPILRGNYRMQGPIDETNCDLLTHMVISDNSELLNPERIQKGDYRGKTGACNICSAPCLSCCGVNKVLMKSNDESAGETCMGNFEIGQPCILGSVAGMTSSDSFSETAAGKAFSSAPNARVSEDILVQVKSQSGRPQEANDDSSCVSGIDEHENGKASAEYSKVKSKTQNIIKVESSEDPPNSLQAGLCSQSPSLGEILQSKGTDAASNLLEVLNTMSQASNEKCPSHVQSPVDVKNDKPSGTKDEQLEGSTEHSVQLSPADMVSSDLHSTVMYSIKENDDMELEHHPADETDDSDIVEQDVKVCDICGDAGQEDLLAFCCRCSDGAEHTYCMREMMAKVPEGDWLCEECKNAERVANERQENTGKLVENEKNNSSGQPSSEYVHSSDVDGQRTKCGMKSSSKRHREDADAEVSSIAKKPTLESIVGSPKTSNSSKPGALSREISAKNLDKGRLQSSHHSSSDIALVNDATEPASSATDPRSLAFRGTFSKSNSFNSLNSKPKVKLLDQVVIQRQKSAREHGSSRLKEGVVRSIGKSMPFKSTNSSQPDSKLKTGSPRLTDTQDTKIVKQKSPFEQRLSRAEHAPVNSMKGTSVSSISRTEIKRTVSLGESSVATGNHHEMKPLHSEGKSATLSRSSSLAARRTSDSSSSLGEFKRPSTLGHNGPGISSTCGVNNTEKKSNQSSMKEEMPTSVSAERPPIIANESSPDGLPQPKDSTNVGERVRESNASHIVPPSIKSSRDENDKLKAAIEAAMIKKPGMCRKSRAIGQSEDSSVLISAGKKRLSCDVDLPDRLAVSHSLNAESIAKETPNNVKQCILNSVECVPSSGGQHGVPIRTSLGEVINNVAATSSLLLRCFAIPEHDYIWQGCFEIYRGGKLFDLWDGLQAHLSTRVSRKVVEAASKFESRLVLYEVPRLSTWPMHFQEYGVTEDSIALFFFAKDLESYDKIYNVLLDNMMKNDLALKGNVNGVELLIFPSNQLPDHSKRWNMLFFLWGVFRGKKENHLQQIPDSVKQFGAVQDIPKPIMSLADNRCSQRPIAEDLPASEDASPVLGEPTSEKFRSLFLSSPVNGDFGTKVSVMDQTGHGINSTSLAAVQHDTKVDCQEIKNHAQEHLGMRVSTCSGREQGLMQSDTLLNRFPPLHHSAFGTIKNGIGEGTVLNKTGIQNQVKPRIDPRDPPSMDRETSMECEWFPRDLNVEPDKWKECAFPAPYVMPRTQYATASQVSLRNDEMHEALKTVDHIPSGSDTLQNQRKEVSVEALIREHNENAERHFFPVESHQPVKGMRLADGVMPWKMHMPEQEQLSDRVPNLELALGAEKGLRALDIQPPLLNKLEPKVKETRVLKVAGPKVEDDVSATLSLSLSFPFPKKELGAKPATKTGQFQCEREHTNKSVLFGNLGDN